MTGVLKVDDIQDAGANSIVSSNGSGTLTFGSFTAPNITASTALLPDASDGAAIGSASLEWSDLFLADGAVINLGDDQDVTLTHVADTGITLNSTNKLMFNDASQFIQGSSATVLSIAATDEIDLTATAVDLNGTLNVSGVATFQATPVFPDGSIAVADLDIDGATDIGAAIVDADLFIVDDGAGGTNRKVTASRLKTYASVTLAGIDDQSSSNDDQLTITDSAIVINEDSDDVDFRVESNGNTHAFFVDGQHNSRIVCGAATTENAGGYTPQFAVIQLDDNPIQSIVAKKNNDGGPSFVFVKSRNTAVGSYTIVQNGDVLGAIRWAADDGGDTETQAGIIDVRVDAAPGTNDIPGRMGFAVTADGSNSGTERFRISNNGDLTASDTSIGSLSDERMKENVADFTYDINTFKSIKPRTFTWKNPVEHSGTGTKRGFIAQELGAVDDNYTYTYALNKESEDYNLIYNDDGSLKDESAGMAQAARLGQMDAMYVSVIKQLITKIETLETKVKALEDA